MVIEKTVAAADCETDPFDKGKSVYPFIWGLYTGDEYLEFRDNWRKRECGTTLFLDYLSRRTDPLIIYAHNGGKFDWLFLVESIRGTIKTINGRIVKAYIGPHELRDSFANIPVPLAAFGGKLNFDYDILRKQKRDKPENRAKISEYLKQDCVGLWQAIVRYRDMFGDALTMAGAAMKELNKVCTGNERDKIYQKLSADQDKDLRQFYYGGRVQCFERGIIRRPLKIYDLVSAYPSVMRDAAHPISNVFVNRYGARATLEEETDFLEIDATAKTGCLPHRTKAGLSFPVGRHSFFATGPEVRAALGFGILDIHGISRTITGIDRVRFGTFIDTFFSLRMTAKEKQDKALILFYKLVMNSAYGRFALNPEKFVEEVALPDGEFPEGADWIRQTILTGLTIWERPAPRREDQYANVATGASITAFTRVKLLDGIMHSRNPIYCDTDSVICESMSGVEFGKQLGQWQHEGDADVAYIAGKKMYSLRLDGEVVKMASKGVRLQPEEIESVAMGNEVIYWQNAPVITRDGIQRPLAREGRKIRRTGLGENHV